MTGRQVSTLIVGGGPAGAATAIVLARAGHAPLLYEGATQFGDGVCGGFLGWDTLLALERLGIDATALGARPIHRLRLVTGTRTVELALPRVAAGLSRRVLDRALITAAQDAGAQVSFGIVARAADPLTRMVRLGTGETIDADALFLATGKHDLRGMSRDLSKRTEAPSVGLRASLDPCRERERVLADTIELHLFDGGYAGLLLQEDGRANLCLSVARRRLSAAGGLAPLVAAILEEAPRLSARIAGAPLPRLAAVAGVPYGWRSPGTHSGVFRVGDQGAVIASLAGDGIAIALTSGTSAAQALIAGGPESAAAWQADLRRTARRPLAVAEALRRAAERRIPRGLMLPLLRVLPGLGAQAALLTRIS